MIVSIFEVSLEKHILFWQVALHQWLHQNMESVVSMYEDRFDLCTFERRVVEESSESAENFKWWKKLSIRRSMSLLPDLSFVVITPVSVSVKRTKELRALNGWYIYFSAYFLHVLAPTKSKWEKEYAAPPSLYGLILW